WGERRRHLPGTATSKTGGDGDVLPAVDRERDREALHRCAQAGAPQHFSVSDVDGFELPIEIADECDAARGREDRRQERRALLQRPHFLEAVDVEGRVLSDVAVGPGNFEEAPIGAAAAAPAGNLLDFLRADGDAALADRNDQLVGGAVMAHCLPVLPAFLAPVSVDPLADLVV